MSNLGYVTKTGENRFEGALSGMLTWNGKIRLQPLGERVSENAPEMEIVTENGVQIGTARVRVSKKSGQPYVNLAIKHPQITGGRAPLYANLGAANDVENEDGSVFAIIAN
jgi:uncharacterized protein (DUF736 family)